MLKWARRFVLVAVVAAIFGFGGLAGAFATVAKVLFFVFLGLVIASVILRVARTA